MTKIDDTGPAFPVVRVPNSMTFPGMTMRDWFAGQVVGAVYRDLFEDWRHGKNVPSDDWPMGISIDAYRIADAMIRARKA